MVNDNNFKTLWSANPLKYSKDKAGVQWIILKFCSVKALEITICQEDIKNGDLNVESAVISRSKDMFKW